MWRVPHAVRVSRTSFVSTVNAKPGELYCTGDTLRFIIIIIYEYNCIILTAGSGLARLAYIMQVACP